MSIAEQTTLRVVLYEGEGAEPFSSEARSSLLTGLLSKGYSITRTAVDGQVAGPDGSHLLVLGHFTRPDALPSTSTEGPTQVRVEAVSGSTEETLARVDAIRDELGAADHSAWKPWFPVIDYDRCTNCMQCLSFCLFDVYGVDEDKQIQVQNNDNCKTNCPACSRVCPEVAIMFPKYGTGPINGEPVKQADVERESMKVDITSLLGGDIYSSLRTRSEKAKSRFSKERSPDKALNERKRCLTKLQQSGIIPAEVLAELDLASLPSPEEIQRKAEELAALQDSQSAGAE